MKSTQYQRILDQYASQAGRSFYRHVMGDGSDHIHYGLYHSKETHMLEALTASCRRLFEMVLPHMDGASIKEILDLGAGAGGPTGSFDKLPLDWSKGFDLIWSQDALCHALDRVAVFSDARRVLRMGGSFIFSDILLAENAPEEYARAFTAVNAVQNLGTTQSYYRDLQQAGFTNISCEDWTSHLPMNFLRMRQQIEVWRSIMLQEGVSSEMIEKFATALDQRLQWPPGTVLNWNAFLCIAE